MSTRKKRIYTPRTIDIDNFTDCRNTAFSFKVTEDELRAAVNAVGNIYDDVQRYLKSYQVPYFYRRDRGMKR